MGALTHIHKQKEKKNPPGTNASAQLNVRFGR